MEWNTEAPRAQGNITVSCGARQGCDFVLLGNSLHPVPLLFVSVVLLCSQLALPIPPVLTQS
jgi:hypothetical protein